MKKNKKNLPNFLIVGTAKAATTSLYYYLKQHPDIFLCSPKEPLFLAFANEAIDFNQDIHPITRINDYGKLFVAKESYKAIGEASTLYLYKYEKSIKNIIKYLPEREKTKIIILLRNPIDRAFSHYMMRRRHGLEKLSFEKAIEQEKNRINEKFYFGYIDMGYYYEQVKAYKSIFKNIKIILFEDIKDSPIEISQEIFKFLEVDDEFVPKINKIYNMSGQPRSKFVNHLLFGNYGCKKFLEKIIPTAFRKEMVRIVSGYNFKKISISKKEKNTLVELYSDDINKLSRLINRDLSKWTS